MSESPLEAQETTRIQPVMFTAVTEVVASLTKEMALTAT